MVAGAGGLDLGYRLRAMLKLGQDPFLKHLGCLGVTSSPWWLVGSLGLNVKSNLFDAAMEKSCQKIQAPLEGCVS